MSLSATGSQPVQRSENEPVLVDRQQDRKQSEEQEEQAPKQDQEEQDPKQDQEQGPRQDPTPTHQHDGQPAVILPSSEAESLGQATGTASNTTSRRVEKGKEEEENVADADAASANEEEEAKAKAKKESTSCAERETQCWKEVSVFRRRVPLRRWRAQTHGALRSPLLSFRAFYLDPHRLSQYLRRLQARQASTTDASSASGGRKKKETPLHPFTTATQPTDESLGCPQDCALLFLSVSSVGNEQWIIEPNHLADFIELHFKSVFVGFNVSDSFWVIDTYLLEHKHQRARDCWWEICNQSRLRDVCILDMLLHLATIDAQPKAVQLSTIVEEIASMTIQDLEGHVFFDSLWELALSSEVPVSLDPESIQGIKNVARIHWETPPASFLTFAVRDPVLLMAVYQKMLSAALTLMEPYRGELVENAVRRFGPLTEGIQVKASICMPQMARNGIHVNRAQVDELAVVLETELEDAINKLLNMPGCLDLFHTDRLGRMKISPISGKPSIYQKRLEELLVQAVMEVYEKTNERIRVPMNPDVDDSMSYSTKKWEPFASQHPFIAAWIAMEKAAKYYQFIANLQGDVIHPKYTLLLRNGRTSCYGPNIQQIPRRAGFREAFIPSPGHVFLSIDYSFIELCTLAAVCEERYSHSMLANVIRDGVDPHAFTAAMFEGMSLDAFLELKNSPRSADRKRFARLRQRAKAINFGIPGGQGAAALQDYAKTAYGVELSLEEAREFRNKLIKEVYPELNMFLYEDRRFMQILSWRLGITAGQCWDEFKKLVADRSSAVAGAVRNIVRGHPFDLEDNPYPADFVEAVWNTLKRINKNPDISNMLVSCGNKGSAELEAKLFGTDVATLTGRLRGGVSFTQACNTPFSGLAADGAKLAIWDLTQVGYRVVAFVHDEFLIELAEDSDLDREASIIADIMCRAMSDITGSIPIKCEYAISRVWSKEAEAVYDENGKLILWEPRTEPDTPDVARQDDEDEQDEQESEEKEEGEEEDQDEEDEEEYQDEEGEEEDQDE